MRSLKNVFTLALLTMCSQSVIFADYYRNGNNGEDQGYVAQTDSSQWSQPDQYGQYDAYSTEERRQQGYEDLEGRLQSGQRGRYALNQREAQLIQRYRNNPNSDYNQ